MKIHFLGTKGYIKPNSKKHQRHTSTLISYKRTRVLIDCGESWLDNFAKYKPNYILLTHAHPDHAFGLKKGADCPVWAPKKCWESIDSFPIKTKKVMPLYKTVKLGSLTIKAFPVIHSIKCPAVGYQIQGGRSKIFYVPDLVWIEQREKALKKISLYIGDGATLYRNMVRKDKTTGKLFGHTTIKQQLSWCKKFGVPKMVVTHVGSDIVKNEIKATKWIEMEAAKKEIDVMIAYDKMQITLP